MDAELSCLGRLPELIARSLVGEDPVAWDQRGNDISALRDNLRPLPSTSALISGRARPISRLSGALAQLEQTYRATVESWPAVEAKDECARGHLYRVSRYGMLVTALVAPEHANDPQFEYGFLLHDIGKLMVPDMVLNKPGALSDDERKTMRAHPENGRSILAGVHFLSGAREIVFAHHERWDGSGYPRGLRERQIPLGARIFALCDAFDVMTTNRPHLSATPFDNALDQSGAPRGPSSGGRRGDAASRSASIH